jgi:hypothetical protein
LLIVSRREKDGDALRLAIGHRISIKQQYGRVAAKAKSCRDLQFP